MPKVESDILVLLWQGNKYSYLGSSSGRTKLEIIGNLSSRSSRIHIYHYSITAGKYYEVEVCQALGHSEVCDHYERRLIG
jgi:hypothetical protein